MWHEVIQAPPYRAMMQAAGGAPRYSVRRLTAFDEAEALLLAARRERHHLQRLQALMVETRLHIMHRHDTWQVNPLPLLVLDGNARAVMLWPLLHWLAPTTSSPFGARGMVTLAGCHDSLNITPLLPGAASLSLTSLQGRALMRAVLMSLPRPADLFLCRALSPTVPSPFDTAQLGTSLSFPPLPGCRRVVHVLSWRGIITWLRMKAAPARRA